MNPQKTMEQVGMAPEEIARKLHLDPNKAEPVLKSVRDWVIMISAALYVLSPLDLIPEAIFGVFGWVDDAVVILLTAFWYYRKYQTAQRYRNTWNSWTNWGRNVKPQ